MNRVLIISLAMFYCAQSFSQETSFPDRALHTRYYQWKNTLIFNECVNEQKAPPLFAFTYLNTGHFSAFDLFSAHQLKLHPIDKDMPIDNPVNRKFLRKNTYPSY